MADPADRGEGAPLQFERAEYGEGAGGTGAAGPLHCASCQRELIDEYFEVNGQPICEPCRVALAQSLDANSVASRLLRALAAGASAGVVGAGIYYAVLALTGYEIGLIAILVGFLVGAGVRWGSRGRGGLPFQALAAGLTYLSIVSTYIPFMLAPMTAGESQSPQSTAATSPASQPAARPAAAQGPPPGESREEFTRRITTELRAANDRAADAFAEGNAARDADDWPRAERLYREVLQLAPQFDHAARRLCDVLVRQGRRDEGLSLCRQAVLQNPSVFNIAKLADALSSPSASGPPPQADITEAVSRANGLLDRTDLDEDTLGSLCVSGMQANDLALLRRASARLDEVGSRSPARAYCGWLLSMAVGDFDQAEVRLTHAREAGMEDKAYQELLTATTRARSGPGLAGLASLLALAIAAPFLAGFQNVIGIAIIGFAVYQAWRMNPLVTTQFDGPFRVGSVRPGAAGGGGLRAM